MKQQKLFALILSAAAAVGAGPAAAQLSIGISINVAPPPLPVYVQPPLPGPDFLWTPGYWAWDDDVGAYFWVPGTWVRAPRPGLLWTPPWWGWIGGAYVFHSGYWGPHVGFYGGVPYGFGYAGTGFQGGRWDSGHVSYNTAVTNVTNVSNVTNVYRTTVVENRVIRVSYNGGPGGVQAHPSFQEQAALREAHVAPTGNQQAHLMAARSDPRLLASANHGQPPVLATARPLLMAAHGGPASAPIPGGRPPLLNRGAPVAASEGAHPAHPPYDAFNRPGSQQGDRALAPGKRPADGHAQSPAKRDTVSPPRFDGAAQPPRNAGGHSDPQHGDAPVHTAPPPRMPAPPHPNARPGPPRPPAPPKQQPHPHPQAHPHAQGEHHDEHH